MLDHLGWSIEHVFGHLMTLAESGGMIACKVATMAPDRIQSLALLNVTGEGFQCFPKLDRLSISIDALHDGKETPGKGSSGLGHPL